MPHSPLRTGVLAAAVLLAASPAAAQDFLGRLGREAAARVAAGAVGRVAGDLMRGASAGSEAQAAPVSPDPSAAEPSQGGEPSAPSSAFADPAPINYSAALQSPRELRFSDELTAGKKRLEEFSRYDCNACEGGRAYGSWVKQHVSSLWGSWVLEERVGAMAVGDKIDWNVAAMGGTGRLEVIGDRPVGEWACRQVRWTITRGRESADRLGLFCRGPRGAGQGWYEVL